MNSWVSFAVALLLAEACVGYKITPITNYKKGRADVRDLPLSLGEGPHWDAGRQQLYLVDIVENTVYRYEPSTERLFSVRVGKLACFLPTHK